ncbi:auxin-responsive protein SAUR64-like [Phalaenopsis equestris]|uniref:auxin-responsive protein SAUR64-like n=1 Tax=Phalaenopsis equestris TaxID=78828 RepID=UPI0009E5F894|nr:auxin-responsive protein SAUR64-like [Phalaenopsis equestris]
MTLLASADMVALNRSSTSLSPYHLPQNSSFLLRKAPMSSNSYKLGELLASKWRWLASKEGRRKRSKGHFVFYAKGGKRFLVPLKYLQHPIFRVLLEVAKEEFGYGSCGPLRVPCEEELMDHLVSLMEKSCHATAASAADGDGVVIKPCSKI